MNFAYKSGAFAVSLALGIALCAPVYAAQLRTGDAPNIGSTEAVADDVYAFGGTVTAGGNIQGDFVGAGGTLLINGPVTGDVIVAGGNIAVLGAVSQSVRAAGGTLIVNSSVGEDVVVAGGQITVQGAGVGRDVWISGGTITLAAPVGRNVKITGGDVTINGPVAGNVEMDGGTLTLGSAAVIAGNLTYSATAEATMAEGARVQGTVTYTPREKVRDAAGLAAGALTAWFLLKFLMLLVASAVIAFLLRRYSMEVVHNAYETPFTEFGKGLITVIVLPVVSVILLATLIGIPFGIMGLLAFVITLIFGWMVAPILLGALLYKLMRRREEYEVSWGSVLTGVIAYFILGIIPVLGWLVQFVFMLMAIGAMLDIKLAILRQWR